jgi:asparagine synthase (glutamine-hydrolysing)
VTALAAVLGGDRQARDGVIRRMLDAASHRGAGPAVIWSSSRVTLGCRASSSRGGVAAPAAQSPDGSAVVLDGRVDNLDELRRELSAPPDASAAAVILAAYARWQLDAARHLLGDFAYALWDAPGDRLIAARDALGQRPLFYAAPPGTAIVGSEPQQILAHPAMPARINDAVVAEFLTGRPVSLDETLWAGLQRLRPAHTLVAGGAGVSTRRHWDFDPEARLDYASDAEYDDHFRALFRDAVACRVRGSRTAGIFLSGGLDSSAIAGVAGTLARATGAPPPRAYSLTFPGLAVDETRYIDAVTAQWDLPSIRIVASPPARDEIDAEIARCRDLPTLPNGAILNPLRRAAAAEVDVVLTGYGGDDWFTGSPLHTTDLLRRGRLLAAAAQLAHDTRLPGRGYSLAGLIRSTVAPLLSPRTRSWLRPVAGARRPSFPWIRPEFAARVALADRLRWPTAPPFRTLVQSEIHRVANSLAQTLGDELEDRAAAVAGLEQRHPFNDRRVAEFGFALPEAQRWRGGVTKVLMRRALAPELPPVVRARNDKAEFTPTLLQAIDALGGRGFLTHLAVAEAGWVDAVEIQRVYDEMRRLYSRGDESYIPLADAVWSVASVELWLTEHSEGQLS